MNTEKQRSASQRIEDLENAMRGVFQTVNALSQDMGVIKNAIKLINGKIDAVIKVADPLSGISEVTVNDAMVEANVLELKAKADQMLEQGLLAKEETVSEDSFVVGQEVDAADNIVNPRIQFFVKNLPEEIKAKLSEKLVGAAVGSTVIFEEGKLGLLVLEAYSVVTPSTEGDTSAEIPKESTEEAAQA